jgi:hypothetical protein
MLRQVALMRLDRLSPASTLVYRLMSKLPSGGQHSPILLPVLDFEGEDVIIRDWVTEIGTHALARELDQVSAWAVSSVWQSTCLLSRVSQVRILYGSLLAASRNSRP